MINLAAITIERYLKIVHPVWANGHLRNSIIYSVAGFAWISGITVAVAMTVPTTDVVDGRPSAPVRDLQFSVEFS